MIKFRSYTECKDFIEEVCNYEVFKMEVDEIVYALVPLDVESTERVGVYDLEDLYKEVNTIWDDYKQHLHPDCVSYKEDGLIIKEV